MQMPSEIEIFANDVKSAGSAAHVAFVDGFPSNATAAIHVTLDPGEILRLIAIIKPRLLYVHQEWFDYDAAVEECLTDLGLETGDDLDISPLSALKRYGKAYNGKLCLVYVGFVVENVLHLCLEESDWYSAFQDDVEELSERLKAVLVENRKKLNLKLALEVKRKAEILAKDPAFNFNRAGREKRTYLAEELFPDSDWSEISQIVDEATNIDFLNKARSTDS
jgi:hypothetical protein